MKNLKERFKNLSLTKKIISLGMAIITIAGLSLAILAGGGFLTVKKSPTGQR